MPLERKKTRKATSNTGFSSVSRLFETALNSIMVVIGGFEPPTSAL